MLIVTKIHALEILEYVLYRSKEREKAEIIRKSMVELKRFEFRLDEEVFFKEISKRKEGVEFMQAKGIYTLEELVIRQNEYMLKYRGGICRRVRRDADFCFDDAESEEYLD